MPSPSRNIPAAAAKPQRVLACILCQSRKVKCDRNFPCSNCVKSGATCVPAGSIARQRRRRFPERELLDRLRRYEGLLRHNKIDFEPLHPSSTTDQSNPVAEGNCFELSSKIQAIDIASSVESPESEHVDDTPNSKTINIWHVMNQRSQSPSEDGKTDVDEYDVDKELHADIRLTNVKTALSHLFEDDDDGRFNFGARSDIDPITLHPSQVDMIRIWQIYLDNVNPLLKVTHTPTLQTRIIAAAADLASATPQLQALMFGIYCVSMLTLSDDECITLFGNKCGDLLRKFQLGCRQALLRSGVLRTDDRDCLTALFLYLLSTKPRAEPRSLSTNLAVAIRLAQHMGLHSEDLNSKHTALEAEMRRRIWWSLVLLDTRVAEMSDFKCSILLPGWDCKPPSNIHDFDLGTETKMPPAPHEMITESTFAVVRCELANFVRHSGYWLAFNNPCLMPLARRPPVGSSPAGDELAVIENLVEEKYLKFCNPANPIHFMIVWMARGYLAKHRMLAHYARHARAPSKQTEDQRDLALGYALTLFECDTKLLSSPLTKVFTWFTMTVLQFPFQAYIHVVQDLARRPTTKLAGRAWAVMSANYTVRFTHWLGSDDNPLANIISRIVLQAWEARRAAVPSETETVPGIVESMMNRKQAGMTPDYSHLPSWIQQGTTSNDDSWMPVPIPAPMPMMSFDTFDPAYNFAWPDPMSNMQDTSSAEMSMDSMNWGNTEWSSLRGGGQGW
ncbi:hypothetical protein PSPO01_01668 [Paraphaeosphaeria sporulosa]